MRRPPFFAVFPLFLMALIAAGVYASPGSHTAHRTSIALKPVAKIWLRPTDIDHHAAPMVHQLSPAAKPVIIYPYWHVVQPGETLSSIAAKEYGRADYWTVIYRANKALIGPNYSAISAGWRLKIVKHTGSPPPAPAPPAPPPASPAPPAPPVSSPSSSAPAASAPAAPAASTTVSTSGMSAFQACVIARESGGNPSAVNPSSGAGGLYQFLPSTWAALGHSGLPQNASVAEQNQAFQQEYAQSGTAAWGPYDGC